MASDVNITFQNGSDAITTISMAVAALAAGICAAQAVAAAGALLLNGALVVGGVYKGTPYTTNYNNAQMFTARRLVAASSSAGDNTQSVIYTGTDRYGNALSETLALNGVTPVTTVNDFATLTGAAATAALAGNITLGTSAKASGAWIPIERVRNNPISISLLCALVSGAANFTVEETFDEVLGNQPGALFPIATASQNAAVSVGTNFPPVAVADATIAAKAATTQGTITQPFNAFRLTVNSGLGVVQMQALTALMAT